MTTFLLVAVFLTCAAKRCGYRNRIRKHSITQMYTMTPPTTTTLITKTTPTTTRTTTKSTECILKFGVTLKVGQKYTKEFPGGCYVLECTPERVIGAVVKCTPPMCVDYVKPVGACCPSCPKGKSTFQESCSKNIFRSTLMTHVHDTVCRCFFFNGFV